MIDIEKTLASVEGQCEKDWCQPCHELAKEIKKLRNLLQDAILLRGGMARFWELAAREALRPRIMLLTHTMVEDGIISDDHPTIRIRAQMRQEIHDAFMSRAKEYEDAKC